VKSGRVKCWGPNNYGQLGNGTKRRSAVAVFVKGLRKVRTVAVGDGFACALLRSWKISCWGVRTVFRKGKLQSSSKPVTMKGIVRARALTVGPDQACAVVAHGKVKCWLAGSEIYLDMDRDYGVARAEIVKGIRGARAVTTAGRLGDICAVLVSGRIECWSFNFFGNGKDWFPATKPVAVKGISHAIAVSTSAFYDSSTCALLADRTVACWGDKHVRATRRWRPHR